ncbi:MAG: Gfo/Idh/MocA family oxidoreductase [Verrucomicrobiae bacterium]|nr:Gfo/Idh/MocA family oxidoreductase [Verrucomicrobiae bacterium]
MPPTPRTKIGLVGCGAISPAYFKGLKPYAFLEVAACADLDLERAKTRATEFGISRACTVEELFATPDLEIVVNLTIPSAHASVALKAISEGKSVISEKPLALNREEGLRVLEAAKKKGVRVGCAPDTFLGAGIQTSRKLLDDGWIGAPVGATAFMLCAGHERWHPSPEFYYQRGGGPLFDMGPYYLTSLINLLGPVARVAAFAKKTHPTRVIASEPKRGQVISVEVPTHASASLEFRNGVIGTLIMSFDVWAHTLPCIEIYGTEGSLSLPDPNGFGGVIRLRRKENKDWGEIPHAFPERSRGAGPADMAKALQSGRPHRASGELAFHVLDVMCAIHESAEAERAIDVRSTCDRPAPLPLDLVAEEMDA